MRVGKGEGSITGDRNALPGRRQDRYGPAARRRTRFKAGETVEIDARRDGRRGVGQEAFEIAMFAGLDEPQMASSRRSVETSRWSAM